MKTLFFILFFLALSLYAQSPCDSMPIGCPTVYSMVNVSGTAVTWVSGAPFTVYDAYLEIYQLQTNSGSGTLIAQTTPIIYKIATVNNTNSITLVTPASPSWSAGGTGTLYFVGNTSHVIDGLVLQTIPSVSVSGGQVTIGSNIQFDPTWAGIFAVTGDNMDIVGTAFFGCCGSGTYYPISGFSPTQLTLATGAPTLNNAIAYHLDFEQLHAQN